MNLKELQSTHAENLTDAIVEKQYFDRKEICGLIRTHLQIYTTELARSNIKNIENTIEQYKKKLRETTSETERKEILSKIEKLLKDNGRQKIIMYESSRENKYRKLRRMLEEKGLKEILEEFDKEIKESNEGNQ